MLGLECGSRYMSKFVMTQAVVVFSQGTVGFSYIRPRGGGGGGGHLRYVFRGRRGLFLRPPHVRDFVKEGYFFVRSMGVKIPLQSTKYTRL